MKHLVAILSILIIMSALPAVAAADEWEEYMAFSGKFYRLDEQEFNNITCNIASPMLTELVRQTRAQVEPLKDNIEITADLSGFILRYSKSAGLQINRPELQAVIKSEEGLANPDQVKSNVQWINMSFKQVIKGFVMQLAGIFEEYAVPVRENFDELEVVNAKDGLTTATYKRGGSNVRETFSGNKLEFSIIGARGEEHTIQNYEKIGGDKLILKNASVTENEPLGKIDMDLSLTYQKVGSVVFPKNIVTKIRQEVQTLKQEGQTEINLNDCTID